MNFITNRGSAAPSKLKASNWSATRAAPESGLLSQRELKPKKVRAEKATSLDPGIISLKILAAALMNRIESLQEDIGQSKQLNLQSEVHRFEADLIRMALIETGGRQRRAAKLLGLKATTLSTKIKRHGISVNTSQSLDEAPTGEQA